MLCRTVSVLSALILVGQAQAAFVPSYANPWLAGMPGGSHANDGGDLAPAVSPVQVAFTPGNPVAIAASGSGSHGSGTITGPDGDAGIVISLSYGPENGIADIIVPINALLGVFLDDSVPAGQPLTAALNFSTPPSRDYLSLSPLLRQPFFVGDGLTSGGVQQQIIPPAGAIRLFLGTMDGYEWRGNPGGYTVNLPDAVLPEPAALSLIGFMVGSVALRRR